MVAAVEAHERRRGGWTAESRKRLGQVQRILDELRDYWPLTLRQVYYQLVAALVIENVKREYKRLSELLTKARLDGLVPWDALEDRTRTTLGSDGWSDYRDFVTDQARDFLDGYRRDLLQTQDVALEVWIEKDALSRICHSVAFDYCVPVIVARGFSSVSYVHECRQRVETNTERGKRTRILYFGDLDPSGWEMLPAMLTTLQDEMKLGDQLEGVRSALTPEQVMKYRLPRSVDAMKDKDSRTPKFKAMLRREGHPTDLAVELDALPPATLEALVRQSIEQNLDLSMFERERRREAAERKRVVALRSKIQKVINLETR